jgi:hypothetical protein
MHLKQGKSKFQAKPDRFEKYLFTHWPNLASTMLKQLAKMARKEKKKTFPTLKTYDRTPF